MTDKIVVAFSGGRSSAYALKLAMDRYGKENIIPIFTNTGVERNETLEFVHTIQNQWDIPIVWLEYDSSVECKFKIVDFKTASRNGQPFEMAIKKNNGCLPNFYRRFCTAMLKIQPMGKYLNSIGIVEYDKVLGIRADELNRVRKIKANQDNALFPLVDMGIAKMDVRRFWKEQSFDLQLKDYEGNCTLCFHKSRNIQLTILLENPHLAKWWIEQEFATSINNDNINGGGYTFNNGYSIAQLLKRAQQGRFKKAVDALELAEQAPNIDFSDSILGCYCGD